ncbi:MAG: hypothetical protein HOH73_02695 [Alphaproteobacteria bacterium]|jgi:hypothetical protein|nr:hypothetical protein [Alphaproteobacteria bacterium]
MYKDLEDITSPEKMRKAALGRKVSLAILLLLRGVPFNLQNLLHQRQAVMILAYLMKKPPGVEKTRMEMLKSMISLVEAQNPGFTLKMVNALEKAISAMKENVQSGGAGSLTSPDGISVIIGRFTGELDHILQKDPLQQKKHEPLARLTSELESLFLSDLKYNKIDEPVNNEPRSIDAITSKVITLVGGTQERPRISAVEKLLDMAQKAGLLPDFIKVTINEKGNKLWQIKGEMIGMSEKDFVNLQDLSQEQLQTVSSKLAEVTQGKKGFVAAELSRRLDANLLEGMQR